MSLLEQASLIVTPNGFKESKLYSVVPSDGAGDMTVVRATTATRVNADGLIETVPKNLLTYSEQFDNAAWTVSNATITSNSIVAPNGTTTADTISGTTIGAEPRVRQTTAQIGSSVYSLSCYAKKGTVDWVILRNIAVNLGGGSRTWFNLNTGVVGTTNSGISATIESVGNGWYRCTIYGTTDASPTNLIDIAPAPADNDFTTNASGENVYIYGAQLNSGSTATSYFPTTDRLNIPRIDYTSGQGAILVEPQRTNLVTYSEQFDNGSWVKTRATVTSNATTSPDGTTTADKFIPSVDNNTHILEKAGLTVTAQIYTATLYAKKAEYDTIRINMSNYWSPVPQASFNLTTKTTFNVSDATAVITELSDGWFKLNVIATVNPLAGGNGKLLIYAGNDGELSLTGDGTSGVYIWGAQLEAGSYPTSYIPTVASTVTRNADLISKTGISDLINSEEGVLFFEGNVLVNSGAGSRRILLNKNGSFEQIRIDYTTNLNQINAVLFDGVTNQCVISYTLSDSLLNTKIAFKYKENDFALFINGVKVGTDLSGTTLPSNTLDFITLSISGNYFYGKIKSLQVYNTALTDAELTALTTI